MREIQIKATVKYHYTLTKKVKILKTEHISI